MNLWSLCLIRVIKQSPFIMSRFHYRQIETTTLEILDSILDSYHQKLAEHLETNSPELSSHLHLIKKSLKVTHQEKRQWMLKAYVDKHMDPEQDELEKRRATIQGLLEDFPPDIKGVRHGTDFIYRKEVEDQHLAEEMEEGHAF